MPTHHLARAIVLGLLLQTVPPARSALPLDQARWLVRDVADDAGWTDASPTLRVEATTNRDGPPAWSSTATVTDTTGNDRAVSLALAIPFDATGWTWHDDPQASRPVTADATAPLLNPTETQCGVGGVASLYPFAVLSNGDRAMVLAVPPEPARMVRFVYDPARKELRAEFDFGLSAVPTRFPSRADAAVIAYEVPARWAFRQAIARYWSLYPDAFARRPNTPAGIWLPFGDIRPIDHPADFGIAAHECADHQVRGPDAKPFCDADERAGAQTFPYVEPPTYWQQYAGPAAKAGYEERLAQLEKEAADGSLIAQSTLVSGILRDTGKRDLYLDKVAYTTQAPWGSDANPDIPASDKGWPSKGMYESGRLAELLGWKGQPNPGVDGVYVDSTEGWGTILNYNRDHWRVTRHPLTFDPHTKKVAAWNFWGTYAFVADMAKRLRADGKLLMANDAYFRFWFPFPHIDVPGREYTWTDKAGNLAPVPEERYLFFKTMSGRRPYLMLMNNRYEDAAIMEPYFQRSLFYAVYPSMFLGHQAIGETAYFSNPAWYNRDRELFKKYIPLIRQLDLAGWQPVPHATATPTSIRVERYGTFAEGTLAFTLHNPTDREQQVVVTVDRAALGIRTPLTATERITGKSVASGGDTLQVTIPARGYGAVGMR